MTDWYEVYWSDVWVSLYVHPMEVIRETEHTIFTEHGKTRKKTKRSRFFPTYDEARDFAIKSLDNRIYLLKSQKDTIEKQRPTP